MIRFIETTGRSEEDAISAALFQLGLDRDEVSVKVIERAKSGFLGFGGNPAKVRVSYEMPDDTTVPEKEAPKAETPVQQKKPAPPPPPPEQEKTKTPPVVEKPAPQKPAEKPAPAVKAEGQTPVEAGDEKAARITEFLTGLMAHMNVNAAAKVSLSAEGGYKVVLQGQGLGAIIGRRGETLDAIQQITNYAVNHGQSKRVRIHIDAENYRAKREEALERLALKVAGKVVKYRKNVTLEAMNAYERHIIHATLQEYKGISTYSTGVDPNRRTVVAYSPEK